MKKCLFILAVIATLTPLANAQIYFTQRTSTDDINPGDANFNGASTLYSIYSVANATNIGDTTSGSTAIRSGYSNLSFYNTGGEVTTLNMATGASTFTFPTSNLNGTTTITYTTGATGFGSSFLQKGVSSTGLSTLEFLGGGNGFLDQGGTFYLDVNLKGNWLTQGTSTGDFQLLGYNSAWSAPTYNFDGSNTQIRLVNTNFSGLSGDGPSLDFKLYGAPAPTPTPEEWVTYGGALGLLALISRRKKSVKA